MEHGEGSVTLIEDYEFINQRAQGNLLRNYNSKLEKIEMLTKYQMWTTLSQTHTPLKMKRSCIFLKIMKL